MSNQLFNVPEKHIRYSVLLSSLLCSGAVCALTILSLLNSRSIDLYSLFCLLKVVIPGGFSFWFIGLIIGTILDKYDDKITKRQINEEKMAYELPSMFAVDDTQDNNDDELGIL